MPKRKTQEVSYKCEHCGAPGTAKVEVAVHEKVKVVEKDSKWEAIRGMVEDNGLWIVIIVIAILSAFTS